MGSTLRGTTPIQSHPSPPHTTGNRRTSNTSRGVGGGTPNGSALPTATAGPLPSVASSSLAAPKTKPINPFASKAAALSSSALSPVSTSSAATMAAMRGSASHVRATLLPHTVPVPHALHAPDDLGKKASASTSWVVPREGGEVEGQTHKEDPSHLETVSTILTPEGGHPTQVRANPIMETSSTTTMGISILEETPPRVPPMRSSWPSPNAAEEMPADASRVEVAGGRSAVDAALLRASPQEKEDRVGKGGREEPPCGQEPTVTDSFPEMGPSSSASSWERTPWHAAVDTVAEETIETNASEVSKGLSILGENAREWEHPMHGSAMRGAAEEKVPPATPLFAETLRKRLREEDEEEEENAIEFPPISIPRVGV